MDGVVQLSRGVVHGQRAILQVQLGPDGHALRHAHVLDLTPDVQLKSHSSVIAIDHVTAKIYRIRSFNPRVLINVAF
jgi:hypothetical protein